MGKLRGCGSLQVRENTAETLGPYRAPARVCVLCLNLPDTPPSNSLLDDRPRLSGRRASRELELHFVPHETANSSGTTARRQLMLAAI